jgi:hypothetical protein
MNPGCCRRPLVSATSSYESAEVRHNPRLYRAIEWRFDAGIIHMRGGRGQLEEAYEEPCRSIFSIKSSRESTMKTVAERQVFCCGG